MKKNKNSSKDLIRLMREKGEENGDKIHSATLFFFWTFILGGDFVALLI